MKKIIILITMMLLTSSIFAQNTGLSFGVIGTHFHNESSDNQITKADNPFSYGLMVTKKLNENFSLALTGEYFNEKINSLNANEKALRFNISAVMHTLRNKYFQPYVSGGIIYTNRTLEYNNSNKEEKDNKLNERLSVGAAVPVYANLFVNADLAMYTDGFNFVGWASTLGLNISL